jgi:hypothetical protein
MDNYQMMCNVLVQESTLYTSPAIKRIISSIPLVTKKHAIELVHPGDILLAYKPKKYMVSISQFTENFISTFQQSPYSSSKYIISKDRVIGYGLPDNDGKTLGTMEEWDIKRYFRILQEGCIVRIDKMTDKKAAIGAKYMRDKGQNKYDFIGLEKAWWNRVVREKGIHFKIQEQQAINEVTHALTCGSLIALSLKKAGAYPKFERSVLNVWPKDFLTTPGITPICRFHYG